MTHTLTPADLDNARRIARGYAPHDDDLESAAMLALVLASRAWDGRGSFRGFASQHVRWAILDELRQHKPEPVDTATLADTTRVLGKDALDDATTQLHTDLHQALKVLRCEFLLDGVDRRYFAHRGALQALRRELT
jgi:DNA-directed RNA polymerase specialized sigma subunit